MDKLLKYLFAIFIIAFSVQAVSATSIYIRPLHREYRKSKIVFVGTVIKIEEYQMSDAERKTLPEMWNDWKWFSKVRFKVTNALKGIGKGEREILAYSYPPCRFPGDPPVDFEENVEYLVFSESKKIVTGCASTKAKYAEHKIEKLNKFWFRSWSSIFPF